MGRIIDFRIAQAMKAADDEIAARRRDVPEPRATEEKDVERARWPGGIDDLEF